MAFTRFHDDPCRIMKQNQQMTDPGRWVLDVPGNGTNPCFMLDPHIIPQKWGGNLWTNSVDIQSSLLGINKYANRDCLDEKKYKKLDVNTKPISYPVCETLTTEQSRTIMPAWTARDLQQNHAYILPDDPQSHTEIPFHNYVNTRIAEKDNFNRSLANQNICNNQKYTLPSIVKTNTKTNNSKK
jgi:hypothetical protein